MSFYELSVQRVRNGFIVRPAYRECGTVTSLGDIRVFTELYQLHEFLRDWSKETDFAKCSHPKGWRQTADLAGEFCPDCGVTR